MWESFVPSKWSSRSPGEPLFSSDIFNRDEDDFGDLSKWNLEDCVFGFKDIVISDKVLKETPKPSNAFQFDEVRNRLNAEIVNTVIERSGRRRPTYSAKVLRALSKESDDSVDSSSGSEDYTASAKDLRQSTILEFRKNLTQTVKIKTAFFYEKVRVMCSKDGKYIEWYKSRSEDDGSRKPFGTLPVSKITNVSTKPDSIKYLEITAGTASFLFMFRSREDRENWQNELKKFLKFIELPVV